MVETSIAYADLSYPFSSRCSGPDRYVVSCVTSVGNLDKVMHVWHCASDSSPNQVNKYMNVCMWFVVLLL